MAALQLPTLAPQEPISTELNVSLINLAKMEESGTTP